MQCLLCRTCNSRCTVWWVVLEWMRSLTLPAYYAERGLLNGRASVRLSVPWIDSLSSVWRVCCWVPCRQEMSISSSGAPAWRAHTHSRLTTLFPGLPRWAGTRKVKPIWILLKLEIVSGWAVCKSAPRSRQTTTPAPHHSVFYRPDALPAAQPTASKHWRQWSSSMTLIRKCGQHCIDSRGTRLNARSLLINFTGDFHAKHAQDCNYCVVITAVLSATLSEYCHKYRWYFLWYTCWLGGRKGIRPVKNWVVGCWHGYLSGAVKSRLVLPFWYRLTRVVLDKGPLNTCVCVCVRVCVCFCDTLGRSESFSCELGDVAWSSSWKLFGQWDIALFIYLLFILRVLQSL